MFTKDRFTVDLDDDAATCPAVVTVSIRRHTNDDGIASFAEHCTTCPRRDLCNHAAGGRTIYVNVHEAALTRARATSGSRLGDRLPPTDPKSNANLRTSCDDDTADDKHACEPLIYPFTRASAERRTASPSRGLRAESRSALS